MQIVHSTSHPAPTRLAHRCERIGGLPRLADSDSATEPSVRNERVAVAELARRSRPRRGCWARLPRSMYLPTRPACQLVPQARTKILRDLARRGFDRIADIDLQLRRGRPLRRRTTRRPRKLSRDGLGLLVDLLEHEVVGSRPSAIVIGSQVTFRIGLAQLRPFSTVWVVTHAIRRDRSPSRRRRGRSRLRECGSRIGRDVGGDELLPVHRGRRRAAAPDARRDDLLRILDDCASMAIA